MPSVIGMKGKYIQVAHIAWLIGELKTNGKRTEVSSSGFHRDLTSREKGMTSNITAKRKHEVNYCSKGVLVLRSTKRKLHIDYERN